MKTGIIGLPGSGKSTVFDLVTENPGGHDPSVPAHKPRVRAVKVRDVRLERLRDDYDPKKYTPATLEVLDFPAVQKDELDRTGVADLLAPAREMDALVIVVRGFPNPAIAGGERVDPVSDLSEVLSELILSDLVIVEKRLEKLDEKSRKPAFSEEDRRDRSLLLQMKERLEKEQRGLPPEWGHEDLKRMSGFGFLNVKPQVIVLNSETGSVPEETSRALSAVAGGEVLSVAARSELEILELPEEDRAAFMAEYSIREFTRDRLIEACYRAARRISFFTAGEKEVRAWTIREGDSAPQAAGAIHTDFERGFIRAEIVSYDDYVKHGGLKGAREHGVYRLEGKEYIVKDGDIILFRFAV